MTAAEALLQKAEHWLAAAEVAHAEGNHDRSRSAAVISQAYAALATAYAAQQQRPAQTTVRYPPGGLHV